MHSAQDLARPDALGNAGEAFVYEVSEAAALSTGQGCDAGLGTAVHKGFEGLSIHLHFMSTYSMLMCPNTSGVFSMAASKFS